MSTGSPCATKTPSPDGVFREELVSYQRESKRSITDPSVGRRTKAVGSKRGLLTPSVQPRTSRAKSEAEADDRRFPSYRLYVEGQKEEAESHVTTGIPSQCKDEQTLGVSEYVKSAHSEAAKCEKGEEKEELSPADPSSVVTDD